MSGKYSVELLEDPHEDDVQRLAAMLGLRKVNIYFVAECLGVHCAYHLNVM